MDVEDELLNKKYGTNDKLKELNKISTTDNPQDYGKLIK